MIEIEIFNDIKDQPAKLVGPFTTRQAVCALGAGLLGFVAYKGTNALFGSGNSYTFLAIMICALPFILLGWIKPYGLPFEKFASNMLYTYLLPPRKRLYKSQTTYEDFENLIEEEEKAALAAEAANNKGKAKTKTKKKADKEASE